MRAPLLRCLRAALQLLQLLVGGPAGVLLLLPLPRWCQRRAAWAARQLDAGAALLRALPAVSRVVEWYRYGDLPPLEPPPPPPPGCGAAAAAAGRGGGGGGSDTLAAALAALPLAGGGGAPAAADASDEGAGAACLAAAAHHDDELARLSLLASLPAVFATQPALALELCARRPELARAVGCAQPLPAHWLVVAAGGGAGEPGVLVAAAAGGVAGPHGVAERPAPALTAGVPVVPDR